MSRSKGDRVERHLIEELETRGWYAQRTGSSGSGTKDPRPDVLAIRPAYHHTDPLSHCAAIEVKAWELGTGQLSESEVQDLHTIREMTGGDSFVAVKPDLRTFDQWHVFRIDELNETRGGNFSVRKSDLPGRSLSEAFSEVIRA